MPSHGGRGEEAGQVAGVAHNWASQRPHNTRQLAREIIFPLCACVSVGVLGHDIIAYVALDQGDVWVYHHTDCIIREVRETNSGTNGFSDLE